MVLEIQQERFPAYLAYRIEAFRADLPNLPGAACEGHQKGFDFVVESSPRSWEGQRMARELADAFCRQCECATACLSYARRAHAVGLWGGVWRVADTHMRMRDPG